MKLFAYDTSLFSVIHDSNTTSKNLNDDLGIISQWAYQWKMSFNPDPTKQAQDIIFSRKNYKDSHPDLVFNDCVVQKSNSQKHLGLYLDNTLPFKKRIKEAIDKANKGTNVLKRLFHYVLSVIIINYL